MWKLLWKYQQVPNFKTKNQMADNRFAILNQSDVEQLKENSGNQYTMNEHRPSWKFGRIGRQNGKSTRKLKSTSTKSSIKCCKHFIPKYVQKTLHFWEYSKQKIARACSNISLFMTGRSWCFDAFSSCNFANFIASLVSINHEMHSRSCNFYILIDCSEYDYKII